MQRYFINKENFIGNQAIITGDDVHHITKVLRSKAGDKVICADGEGLSVICKIITIASDKVSCEIISSLKENRESKYEIILAQALPKADKMDLIIQKGTEIGVKQFIPFESERTVVQWNDKKKQKHYERWSKIAKEAAEQAHRNIIPKISLIVTFNQLLRGIGQSYAFIANEKEGQLSLHQSLNQYIQSENRSKILLIIGPEGGFSEKEVIEAINAGAISISLGKRILRTETAGLVGAANILYHLEE